MDAGEDTPRLFIPLGIWLASTAFTLAGAEYDVVLPWFASRLNAGLLILTALVFFGYVSLAWKVIVEDYIHVRRTRPCCWAC